MTITTVNATIPDPVKRTAAPRAPSPAVVELTEAFTRLPADGTTAIDATGKSAKGVALVAGKIAFKLNCGVRTQVINETTARLWKVELSTEELAKKIARKQKAKAAKHK